MKSTGRKAALAAKIVCASIGVVPAAILVLAQIDISTVYASKAENHTTYFRDILSKNSSFANAKISNIAMLAAHDCMSDGIGLFTGTNTHQTEDQTLYEWGSVLGRGAMVRLSRAQDLNVYEQLNAGVRCIDARITKLNGTYYNSHTLLADKFENNLKLILKWLDENPGEFVLIYIYDFFWDEKEETQDEAWANLKTFIEGVKYNNKNLFDYDHDTANRTISELTYSDVTNGGNDAGAILVYCSDAAPYKPTMITKDPSLYPEKYWFCKHLNYVLQGGDYPQYRPLAINGCALRMDSGIFKDHIESVVLESKEKSETERNKYFKYLQTQTTPNNEDIMLTVQSWSLVEKARYHNRYVLDLFTENEWLNDILPYMPIYMCDNSTCNDNGFNTDVMNLLTKYNLNKSW